MSYGGGGSSWSLVPWEFEAYDDASRRAAGSRRLVARLDQVGTWVVRNIASTKHCGQVSTALTTELQHSVSYKLVYTRKNHMARGRSVAGLIDQGTGRKELEGHQQHRSFSDASGLVT